MITAEAKKQGDQPAPRNHHRTGKVDLALIEIKPHNSGISISLANKRGRKNIRQSSVLGKETRLGAVPYRELGRVSAEGGHSVPSLQRLVDHLRPREAVPAENGDVARHHAHARPV